MREAANAFNVPNTTFRSRMAGLTSRFIVHEHEHTALLFLCTLHNKCQDPASYIPSLRAAR